MPKIIQISSSETADSYGLYALCEDGSVWQWVSKRISGTGASTIYKKGWQVLVDEFN